MIELKTLKWGNLFSYADNNSIEFNKSPLSQIVGLNGHGKSSIALILEEVLFNKNSKNIKKADILNRNIKAKNYWITLIFAKDGIEYTINVTRGSTQTVKLYKGSEDISAHTATGTYNTIQNLIGCDHKTFTQIVYQSSSTSLEFLTATDTNRKKFLIELLNLNKYVEAGDIFKGINKELTDKVSTVETKISSINAWIAKYSKMDLVKKAPVDVPEIPKNLIEEIKELNNQLNSIDYINKKRSNNNAYKKILDAIVIDNTIKPPSDDIEELKSEKANIKASIKSINDFSSKMKKLGTVCPTCEQDVDSHKLSLLCSEQDSKLIVLNDRLAEIEKSILSYNKHKELWDNNSKNISSYEKYFSLYDSELPSELLDSDSLSSRIGVLTGELEAAESAAKKAIDLNNSIFSTNSRIDTILSQLEEHNNDLGNLKTELDSLNKRISIIQLLTKTFSPTGLIAYKIECLIKDLEQAINNYLIDLSGGRFQLTFKIESDKLNVIITDNGKDIDITALSSGEKARVNTSALLGIRKLMQSISNSRINLLVLDETIENLDLEGKEKLVELLLQEEFLNTFIISHSFSHPLLERLYIIKQNNISRIEN